MGKVKTLDFNHWTLIKQQQFSVCVNVSLWATNFRASLTVMHDTIAKSYEVGFVEYGLIRPFNVRCDNMPTEGAGLGLFIDYCNWVQDIDYQDVPTAIETGLEILSEIVDQLEAARLERHKQKMLPGFEPNSTEPF